MLTLKILAGQYDICLRGSASPCMHLKYVCYRGQHMVKGLKERTIKPRSIILFIGSVAYVWLKAQAAIRVAPLKPLYWKK